MIEPLRIELVVACDPTRAFATWTSAIARWWPRGHGVSGDPEARPVLEPFVGGRIYERTPAGDEHPWGVVTAFEPPRLLAYRWHIGVAPDLATDVAIRFAPHPDGGTAIAIEHAGFERLGERGRERRDGNGRGWSGILPAYAAACRLPA